MFKKSFQLYALGWLGNINAVGAQIFQEFTSYLKTVGAQ
jgi:hypothetical protein